MSNVVDLYIAGVEVGAGVEWDMEFEERLGAPSGAKITLQDPGYAINPQPHADVKAVRHSTGWVLYRGVVQTPVLSLPVGKSLPVWTLPCTDYNNELGWRLVGAVDGSADNVQDNGFGNYVFVDPFASTLATDLLTIVSLYDHYFRTEAGDAADTSTYVGEYLAPGSFVPIFWTNSTIQRAIAELAALVAANIQDWIDPDLKVHHVSIPAWSELAGVLSGSLEGLPLLFPSSSAALLPPAPREITDVVTDPATQCGGRALQVTRDGQVMPQQVYVKGATGYSWDTGSPPVGVPAAPVPIPPRGTSAPSGTYALTVTGTVNIYHLDANGYIAIGHGTTAPGGPYYVTPKTVPTRPTPPYEGGNFWLLTSGPDAGFLIHQRSNVLGYGTIAVATLPVLPGPAPDPVVVVGGTGWVGGPQDPTQRQMYVEAPTSTNQNDRDSIGGQALYRGATPTLRGSVVVGGEHRLPDGTVYTDPDGWRAGQVVKITDARLPDELNGLQFMIQRVAARVYSGRDLLEYTIDWGDGAVQRLTTASAHKVPTPDPAVQLYVIWSDLQPAPGSQQIVTAQLVSKNGDPWPIPNRIVNWTLLAVDEFYTVVTGQGTLDPPASTTDQTGKARTTFTAGARSGLSYFAYCDSPAT